MYMNKYGYLERKTRAGRKGRHLASTRIWWLIKCDDRGRAMANVGTIKVYFPQKELGHKVRFKSDVYD